jgi:hypothetical protein
MEGPAFGEQFKTLLLWAGGLILAILVGWKIGLSDYKTLLLVAIAILGACFAFFSGDFFWVVTIASSFLGGTFPILGGSFTPFQILMATGVAKFFVEDIVLKRTHFRPGNRFDLFLIAGFMGILTLHALHDRFGMRFLGSHVWGGRNYVNVYVGLVAFFVVQSISLKPKLWAKLPYVVLGVTGFDLVIAMVTTIFPSSIYKIYPFYSAVSTAGIHEITTGASVEAARIGDWGNFGFTLIAFVLASVSLRQILTPRNLLRALGIILGGLAVLYSSFRSAVLNTLVVVLAAGIRDLRFKVLLLLPVVALFLFGLSFLNSEVVHLPKQVQRSLTFIPGKWDNDMAQDAAASNDFRRQVWTLWADRYFPLHPWLGRGFGFQSQWVQRSIYNPQAVDYRQMVEVGNIHNGFFATVDAFGIVGTLFFIIWNVRLLVRAFRVPFRRDDPGGIALRFVALILGASILCYWVGAASVGSFLPQEFALAGLFLGLRRGTGSILTDERVLSPASGESPQMRLAATSRGF